MEIDFKIAENADTEILVQFIREFYELDQYPFNDESVRSALAIILNDNSLGRVWIIQDGSKAIGYVVLTFGYSLEYQGRDAFIDEIYIQESYRGQGVGTKVFQFVEGVCPSLGIKALHLEVERQNTAAQGFYQKIGFQDHDRYLMTKWITM